MAPNVNLFLYRPAWANPPMCSVMECERATLRQLLDMHELLDLRAAIAERAAAK
ncbi:hypothetical protein [Xanthobacter agilis]|uniref:Uncharacterized protein n=1 Tax=Xanthobacter agilis TaxID=47492 RepID=A0ABU0LAF7_XANAG|nr:hypothetical protein [Xanthobacter agilis]MDQ0504118.1 hypothetical protein [Xanthobacter agilis]